MVEERDLNVKPTTKPESVADESLLVWVTHPAKTRRKTAVIVIAFLVFLVVLVYSWTASAVFTAIAALVLWGSLTQFFLPTTFEFTAAKVKVKYTFNKIEKEWSQYRSYYPDKNGVLLSPFIRPSRLENFRGLYIRFQANRDEVMKIVKEKIAFVADE